MTQHHHRAGGGAHRKPPPPKTPWDLGERWQESGVMILALFVMVLLGLALFLILVVQ